VLVLLKLARAVKLGRAYRALAQAGVHPGLLRLCQMAFCSLLGIHLFACSYWVLATRSARPTLDDLGCDPTISPLVESWGVCPEVRGGPLLDRYFHCFYITAVIMKGSNYPAPLETPSKIFTAFMLLTGALLQASVIAAAASLLANLDRHKLALRQRLDEIGAHLAHHKVDGPLRDRVRAFFEYLFHCGHHTNEDELLEGLSEKLRMQLLLARMRTLVEKTPLFRRLSSPCTLALVDLLVPLVVLPREYVLVQGMLGGEMFFVARGLVQVTIVIEGVEYPLEQLGAGGAFGEGSLLRRSTGGDGRRSMSVLTIRFCELLQLSVEDFDWLCRTFDEFQRSVQLLYAERTAAISQQVERVAHEKEPSVRRRSSLSLAFRARRKLSDTRQTDQRQTDQRQADQQSPANDPAAPPPTATAAHPAPPAFAPHSVPPPTAPHPLAKTVRARVRQRVAHATAR